jgi:hypothetical protein
MINRRHIHAGLLGTLASLLSSCGTIIYPGRVNQTHRGALDPAVVILDGIGLFFFIIPGLIAFAVDFGTGAIYYPSGKSHRSSEKTIFDEWKEETSKTRPIDQQTIERFIAQTTGRKIRLESASVLVQELDHLDQFPAACRQLTIG